MKIAILGPPKVGKSKLARELAREFDLSVVDGYAQRLQRQSQLALGPWSNYSDHFMVAGLRQAAEAKLSVQDKDSVTVGTILDTITYATVKTDVLMHRTQEAVRNLYAQANAGISGLSLIFQETWDYHIAFHLNYSQEQLSEYEGKWEFALDRAYPVVLESYGAPYTYTLNGDHSARVAVAKEIIQIAQESPSETEDQEESTDSSTSATPDE